MEAASDGYGDDFVVVRRENGCELANAFGVAALGEADKKFATNVENIAAFKGARKGDTLEFAKFGKSFCKRGGFRAAGLGAERKNDSELVENDGGILDEHGIGEIRLGGERNNVGAEFFEKLFVGQMLRDRDFQIDWLAWNESLIRNLRWRG